MKILFVPHGSLQYAASRLRIYNYLTLFEKAGVKCTINRLSLDIPVQNKEVSFEKLYDLVSGYDLVFLQRVLFPIRWIKRLRQRAKKIVFDFDDALFYVPSVQWPSWHQGKLPAIEYPKQFFRLLIRGGRYYSSRKHLLDATLQTSDGIITGNSFLANYAKRFGHPISIIPTPIDVEKLSIKDHSYEKTIVIGWIGHPDGAKFVENIVDALKIINQKYGENILVRLCTKPTTVNMQGVPYEIVPWELTTEYQTLATFDIGIMPLTNDGWSRGKCAYKALLYMGAGLPPVVSPVGMNKEIIQEGVTGFIASNQKEWIEKLSPLVKDSEKRFVIGSAARQYVEKYYSRKVTFEKLCKFCERVVNE